MRYRVLLCDADDTLLDFSAAEKSALYAVLKRFDMPRDEQVCEQYARINASLWKALERGETTQSALKEDRFRLLADALNVHRDIPALSAAYAHELGLQAPLMPGAEAFIRAVSVHMPIYVVTNGIASIQKSRMSLSGLLPYIADLIISEEVGFQKPDPAMLHIALERGGFTKRDAVMLGDSLSADIAAATLAGIDSIWIHWAREHTLSDAHYQVKNLHEAREIILSS
ncbi:MAG: YjjG family noncanonical pyrimidine nucleotidase [Clostridia bacterium]|nr:YjjG family noncanonical pyrimidine nucleotidase [Clostridia bacterium]